MAVNVVDDHLAHYGVPGMKWGKRKNAQRREKNAAIDGARGRQAVRKAEVRGLTAQRISANSKKGQAHLDRKIADKKFEIDNNDDAIMAKQLKTSEKVMKGAKIAGLLGMSVVGLGAAASIVNSELNKADNEKFPMSLREYEVRGKLDRGEETTFGEIRKAVETTDKQRSSGQYG